MDSFSCFCGIANQQLAAITDGNYIWILLAIILIGTFFWVARIRAFRPKKNDTLELPPGELYLANMGGTVSLVLNAPITYPLIPYPPGS